MALFVASFVGFGAYTLLSSDESPAVIQTQVEKVVEAAPMVDVIVATQDIQIGKRIIESDLAWRPWPEELWNPNFIRRDADPVKSTEQISNLINGVARFPIASGEPITPVKVFISGERSAMSGLLRDGMRAVAVQISPENSAGGFIVPGDMVDVVLTTSLEIDNKANKNAGLVVGINRYLQSKKEDDANKEQIEPKIIASKNKNMPSEKFYEKLNNENKIIVGGSNQFADTLISNVRVLGIDRNVSTPNDAANGNNNNPPPLGTTATLEVTPEQAKLLAWAVAAGRLTLTLRSMIENSVTKNERQMDIIPKTESSYAMSVEDLESSAKDLGIIQLLRQSKESRVSAPTTVQERSATKFIEIPESKKTNQEKQEVKPTQSKIMSEKKSSPILADAGEHTPKKTSEEASKEQKPNAETKKKQ